MLIEVKVPPLPESVADATLVAWHKRVGEPVVEGENLVDLETDKVTLEVPAPRDGVLSELKRKGDTAVGSDEVIAIIDTEGVPVGEGAGPPTAGGASGVTAGTSEAQGTPKLGPSARRLLRENDLSPESVPPSEDGRVTGSAVRRFVEERAHAPAVAPASVGNAAAATATAEVAERREPLSRLRRRIAERLLAAQRDNAILSTFNEIDMQPVMDLRRRHRDAFEKTHGVKLGFMSFFVLAAVEALRRFPVVNAFIEGDEVVYHPRCDIGIAISTERGLVVPVLRDAGHMSMADVEAAITGFSNRARSHSLEIEDLEGGTFTITNGGVFGSLLSTPILNPPQSGILGMHKIQERPVAVDGQVVIRPMMYVALSYDHRLIDGRDAVQFLVAVKSMLEDPARMLLRV